jgi:hypothetical protein
VLHRASRGKGRYRFASRNAFVVSERLLRMCSSYFMSSSYDRHQALRLCDFAAGAAPGALSLRPWLEVLRELLLGSGWTVLFWHAFCLPSSWALEGALLLPLLIMSLSLRTAPTAAFLASFPALRAPLAAAATGACRLALPTGNGARGVCELDGAPAAAGAGGGELLPADHHLVAALLIFVQYLAPLYIRWAGARGRG